MRLVYILGYGRWPIIDLYFRVCKFAKLGPLDSWRTVLICSIHLGQSGHPNSTFVHTFEFETYCDHLLPTLGLLHSQKENGCENDKRIDCGKKRNVVIFLNGSEFVFMYRNGHFFKPWHVRNGKWLNHDSWNGSFLHDCVKTKRDSISRGKRSATVRGLVQDAKMLCYLDWQRREEETRLRCVK